MRILRTGVLSAAALLITCTPQIVDEAPTPTQVIAAAATPVPATPGQTPTPAIAASENIRVTFPTAGDQVSSTWVVEGEARVFEATVGLRVLDAGGNELLTTFATASGGAPEWGRFTKRLNLPSGTLAQDLTLQVFWSSPRDGSDQDLVAINLEFEP